MSLITRVLLVLVKTMAVLMLLPRRYSGGDAKSIFSIAFTKVRSTSGQFKSYATEISRPPANGWNHSYRPIQINIMHRRSITFFSTSSSFDDLQLRKLTVKELKDELAHRGLSTVGLKADLIQRLSQIANSKEMSPNDSKGVAIDDLPARKVSIKLKTKVNPKMRTALNVRALQTEFDILARKEGFNGNSAYFTDESTFEDDFTDDNVFEEIGIDGQSEEKSYLEAESRDCDASSAVPSMEERIASAKQDRNRGRVSVPGTLDNFSKEVSFDDLKKLGFRRELNPFGNDETPRRDQFKVAGGAMTCSGCGSDFQSDDDHRPGFLPVEKYEIQCKLAKIEEMQKIQEKAESTEWTSEDEIDWLLKNSNLKSERNEEDLLTITLDEMVEKLGLSLDILTTKKALCKRCHGLQNFGKVDRQLRPGWTDEPTLSQDEFKKLLFPLKQKPAVIIALVDLFDFSGSVLPELDDIAGENPVILAANKADLLPSAMGKTRAENWIRRELEYADVKSIANIGGAVRLVSCKTGFGVLSMIEKARSLAEDLNCDIYVVGAANAGKSTLVNYLLDENNHIRSSQFEGKKRAGNANKWKGSITTSPLPGTTLKFIKIELGGGKSLYDTPGLLIPGSMTDRLTPEELKIVVPKKQVEPVTFRIVSGKCVLIGGLARIELIGDCKPFLFTFFVANEIKLHPTDSSKADEFIANHVGNLLKPPLEPGQERMKEIGEFEFHQVDINGDGWNQAAADITLRGLGWIAVTGVGKAQVRIGVPKGVGVSVRPPLMPFDVWESTAKYTGGRAVRKSSKSRSGKRRKGVGRN